MNPSSSSSVDSILPPRADEGVPLAPQSPPRRWGWRFSLRMLLLVQLALALFVGWIAVRVHSFQQQQIVQRIPDGKRTSLNVQTRPASPQWFWGRVGQILGVPAEDVIAVRVDFHALSTVEAESLGRLPQLEELHLAYGLEEAAAMRPIANLPRLSRLNLYDAERRGLDDETLRPLAANRTIKWLTIHSVQVTDEGIARLATMPNLEVLDIQYAKMTIAGLWPWISENRLRVLNTPLRLTSSDCAELAELKSLRDLSAYEVDTAGVEALAQLPKLRRFTLRGPLTTRLAEESLRRFPKNVQVFHDQVHLFGPSSQR
jgi:hypothetical protein